MNELIVVTYKLPASEWVKQMYGDNVDHVYDCVAYHNDPLSETEIKKLKRKYTEVETFLCDLASYDAFVDNETAYEEFVKTGVCPLKPVQEAVDVGTDSKTVNIECNVRIERANPDSSFDYNVDTDDVGQIVFTPYAELIHYESKTRGLEDTEEKQQRLRKEAEIFEHKWKEVLEAGDPFYNRNLSLTKTDCSLRVQ